MTNKCQITHSLCEQILDRLSRRESLAEVARVVAGFGNTEASHYLQEKEPVGVCFGDADKQPPINTNLFVCAAYSCPAVPNPLHACPGDFECNTPRRTYNCGNNPDSFQCEAESFQCNQSQTTSPFSCKQGESGNTADYFDCRTFDCGQVNGTESFDCNSNVDFTCGDTEFYSCRNNFNCTAGHVFDCTNLHSCDVKFTCSGGTVKGCTENGTVQAVSCNPGDKVNNYASCLPNNEYGNNDPGDFLCAVSLPDPDVFDCHKNFDCKAKSDFSCMNTGVFTCAQQGGGENDFDCHSKQPFECYSWFTCASASLFDCSDKENTEYECKSSYALCQSKTEKECKKDYQCVVNHGCPSGAPSADHDCQAPNFNCTTTIYNCSKSIPPFDPWGA
jgi:hypothetical protein